MTETRTIELPTMLKFLKLDADACGELRAFREIAK